MTEQPEYGGQALPDVEAHWREWLTQQREMRAVRDALAAGRSMADVAAVTGLSVAKAEERWAQYRRWPAIAEFGPRELIVAAHVEGSDRQELIEALAAYDYSAGRVYMPWQLQGRLDADWPAVARMASRA